jgi:hypothetical protein
MSETIKSGDSGNVATVNQDNELRTRATSIEQRLHSTCDAKYYELSTGQITLVNATDTGLVYFLNNDVTPNHVIVIDRVFIDTWASTGGTGNGTLLYYRNPTYTGGSAITARNTNFGSTSNISITSLLSLTTLVGTPWWTASIPVSSSIVSEEGRIVIPQGAGFGISYAAPTSNTSQKINITIAMYIFDTYLIGIQN